MGPLAEAPLVTMRRPPKRVYAVLIAGVLGFFVWVMAAIWDIVDDQSVIKTHDTIRRRASFVLRFVGRLFTREGADMAYTWSRSLHRAK